MSDWQARAITAEARADEFEAMASDLASRVEVLEGERDHHRETLRQLRRIFAEREPQLWQF